METQASKTQSKMPEEHKRNARRNLGKSFSSAREGLLKVNSFKFQLFKFRLSPKNSMSFPTNCASGEAAAIPRQNCLECTGSTSGRVVQSDLHRALCQCGYEVTARPPATGGVDKRRGIFSFRCIRCIMLVGLVPTVKFGLTVFLSILSTLRRLLSAGMRPIQSKSVNAVSTGCHLDMRERLHQHCSFFCSTRGCTLLAE